MIISIDGPIGSGKTTLTSLLSTFFEGIDFKHSPNDFEQVHNNSVVELVEQVAKHRKMLQDVFNSDSHDEDYRSRVFFLFNMMRCLLIQSNLDAQKSPHIFIDSFWDPLWTYEIEYVDTYYKVLHECISLPDISFFLRLDEAQSIRRATLRDPDTVHTADAKDLKQKRRDFLEFAKNNIPNFHVLRADRPANDVLSQALKIIKEQ